MCAHNGDLMTFSMRLPLSISYTFSRFLGYIQVFMYTFWNALVTLDLSHCPNDGFLNNTDQLRTFL